MRIKNCSKCGYSKEWSGSDIECCFQDSTIFSQQNWNCGIINEIRDLCRKAIDEEDYRMAHQYCEDQHYVTIKTDDIGEIGLCLWVSWYKQRGATEAMWILNEEDPPRQPTFDELVEIVNYYNNG